MVVAAIWGVRHPNLWSAHLPADDGDHPRAGGPRLSARCLRRSPRRWSLLQIHGAGNCRHHAVVGGLRIVNIPVLFGDRLLPWYVGLAFTVVWVLAITNAFNLIDGLDGLAAGSALFSTMVAFVVALLNGPSLVERS